MKQMRRWLAVVLVLVMAVGLLPVQAEAATIVERGKCGKNVSWTLDSDGTLTISGSGDMYNYDDPFADTGTTAPWGRLTIYENCHAKWNRIKKVVIKSGVTSIGDNAFHMCYELRTISIPNTVTRIGNRAFGDGGDGGGCINLASISIPNGVKSIGAGAFGNTALKNVTIPGSVKAIEASAFMNSSLQSIKLPRGITVIQICTFMWSGIRSINIPASVKQIKNYAFYGCFNLKSVTIDGNLSTIECGAFSDCESLKQIRFKGNAPVFQSSEFDEGVFEGVTATVYYPANNSTWTSAVRKNYGGNITWKTWKPNAAAKLTTPKLTGVQNVNAGIKLTFGKVSGAAKYRILYKVNGKWTKLIDTASTTYTWKKAQNGKSYTFSVQCLDKNGKVASDYNKTGKTIVRLTAPAFSGIKPTASKTFRAVWKKVSGVTGYQIQYCTRSSFDSTSKLLTVKGVNTLNRTFRVGQSGKLYYVRVRAYKTVGGKNYYSAWSSVKKLKSK